MSYSRTFASAQRWGMSGANEGVVVVSCAARWVWQRPYVIFGGSAVLLLPWIVLLGFTQPPKGIADNIEPLRSILVCVIVGLAVATILRAGATPFLGCMLAAAGAGFALSAVWFDVITRLGHRLSRQVAHLGLYAGLVGIVSAALALLCLYRRGRTHLVTRGLLALSALLLILQATSVVTSNRWVLHVDNVGVAWVGLDIGEFVGLALLAMTLRADRKIVLFVGPATAALLMSDAAINILSSGNLGSVGAAVAMAIVECGLAALAIDVSKRRAVRLDEQLWHERRLHEPWDPFVPQEIDDSFRARLWRV